MICELAGLFLKLGEMAFGGPAAHVAIMEAEVMERRRRMDREAFLDLLGTCNLLSGPNSTEMAIHIGHSQAGWPGLASLFVVIPAGRRAFLPGGSSGRPIQWARYPCNGRLPGAIGFRIFRSDPRSGIRGCLKLHMPNV